MKIKCHKCAEEFNIPDDHKISVAICPFCENKNEIETFKKMGSTKLSISSPRQAKHPLHTPIWIMAICQSIITFIIVAGIIVSIILTLIAAKTAADISEEFNNTLEEANKTMKKDFEEIDKSLKSLAPDPQTQQINKAVKDYLDNINKNIVPKKK